jgi:FkbM family methyltransferase
MDTPSTFSAPPIAFIYLDGARYELVLPHADQDHIQRAILQTGAPYELGMLRDMASRLQPGELVLDVGANVGNHAIYLAAVSKARVIAFEPNPELCAALEASALRNNLDNLVSVRRLGLGDVPSKARFAKAIPDNLGAQALALGEGEIEVVPLDALELEATVRILKIDVEGMELAVLRGAQRLVARDRPILYIECQDEAAFLQMAAWAATAGYGLWGSFNATPTHLFMPAETLSLELRLERISVQAALQEYRLGAELRRSRRAEAAAQASSAVQSRRIEALHAALEEERKRVAAHEAMLAEREAQLAEERKRGVAHEATIAERVAQIAALKAEAARHAELSNAERAAAAQAARAAQSHLAELRGALDRTEAYAAKLLRYAQRIETRHTDILSSETWRATEPVRRVLQALKRKKAPEPFAPQLRGAKLPNMRAAPADERSPALLGADPRTPRGEKVAVFLATFPARAANLAQVVTAILPQCDTLTVYLNDYGNVPDCLHNPKIRAILGCEAAGDLKDNGKFYATGDYPDGYHIFVDDDILYPPDYVQKIVAGVRAFGYRAIVGFHGTIYRQPLDSYVRDRTVMPFYQGGRSTVVDQLGTGTVGYHTSTFSIDLSAFETTGLADLWFAKRAAERGVPLVALARQDQWLCPMEEVGETLFRQVQRDDTRESALLRERLAPALSNGPRARTTRFIADLRPPEHLRRARFNLEVSSSGAFAEPAPVADVIHLALIVTGWNCAAYVSKCLASIERQEIGDYRLEILAYDDASDDGTWDRLSDQAERLQIRRFRGERNMGPAYARDFLLRQVENRATICVLLDMDDELLPHALATIERAYRENPDCWLTYGNWVNQNGEVNDQGVYGPGEIDARAYRRQDVFKFTHLRSFRRFLYDAVTPEHLKDEEGEWLRFCSDVGLMLPLVDQCADINVVAFYQPMYVYNQYRSTGTQKRFGTRKRDTYKYLINMESNSKFFRSNAII